MSPQLNGMKPWMWWSLVVVGASIWGTGLWFFQDLIELDRQLKGSLVQIESLLRHNDLLMTTMMDDVKQDLVQLGRVERNVALSCSPEASFRQTVLQHLQDLEDWRAKH